MKTTVLGLVMAALCGNVAWCQEDTVLPTGKVVDLAEARFGKLQRWHKKFPAMREQIEREYARRCNPASSDAAARSLADLEKQPRSQGSASEPGSHEAAAASNLGTDVAKAVNQATLYRQTIFCEAAARQNVERAESLRFLKRVDALMFYGMARDRAERVAANDDLYDVELARLQREQRESNEQD